MSAAPWLLDLEKRVERRLVSTERVEWPIPTYQDDPVRYGQEVLGVPYYWSRQREWMRALVPPMSWVSVASGHKTGKTTGACTCFLWFFSSFEKARVILFSPKVEHIEETIWKPLGELYHRAFLPCAECKARAARDGKRGRAACAYCSPIGEASWWNDDCTKGLRAPDGREIFGYTARKKGGLGGFSGPAQLFGFDEASDVDEDVFESMHGNSAGGARGLLTGNPLRLAGEFYASRHHKKKFYSFIAEISSEEVPNCTGKEPAVLGLALPEWVTKCAAMWGRDSDLFRSRVLGRDPKAPEGQLVALDAMTAAEERWGAIEGVGPLQLGVDVGKTGDPLTVAPRRGRKIFEVRATVPGDHATGAEYVRGVAQEYRKLHERKPRVVYDASGKEGIEFGQELRRFDGEIEIYPVVMTHKPRDIRKYDKMRDEVAWHFAAWLKGGGAIPADATLEGEIGVTRAKAVEISFASARWEVSRVITNEEVKAILGRSPNHRNACELAVWAVDLSETSSEEAASQNARVAADASARVKPRPPAIETEAADRFDHWGAADAGMRAAWGAE